MPNKPDRVSKAGAITGSLTALVFVVALLAAYGGYISFSPIQTSEAPPLAEPIPTAPSTN